VRERAGQALLLLPGRGVAVRHIRRDGSVEDDVPLSAEVEPAQLALFGGGLG
jgi:hypothetical protein